MSTTSPLQFEQIRLRMQGIRKSFGATVALAGVDLDIRAGVVHALIGENGAGKSTLMKVLSGACIPDAGTMQIEGTNYQPRSPLDGRHAGISMIYQELSLAPHLSVMENIMLGVEPTKGPLLDRQALKAGAVDALKQMGRSDLNPNTLVQDLSVAEQQLVEITRAVAVGCRVLVFDEPTSCLTQADTQHLFALISNLKATGVAIVYISHVLEEVKQISTHFTVLRDGQTAGSGQTSETSVDEIVSMMVGRDITELYPRSPRLPGEVVLRLDHLSGQTKPRAASLALQRGQVLGIAGLIGAGRTELLRAIFGLDPIRSGDIKVLEINGPATPQQRWQQQVGFVSENRKEEGLATDLSITDNLTLAHLPSRTPLGFLNPNALQSAAQI